MRNTTRQIFPNFFLTVSYLHACPRQFVTIFLFPLYFLWKLKRVVLHRPLEKLQNSSSACKSQAFLYLQCLQKGISCFIMISFPKLLGSWSILLLVYFFFDELLIHTLHILVAALLPFHLIYLYLLSITCITNTLLKYDFLLFLVVVMYNTFTFQWNWVSCCFSALPVLCEVLFRIVCYSDDDHIPDIFFSILSVFSANRYYVHMEVWFWYGEIQEWNCFLYEKANSSAIATELFVLHHL